MSRVEIAAHSTGLRLRLPLPRLFVMAHSSSLIQSIAVGPDVKEERRPNLKLTLPADATAFVPASVLLQRLHDEAPTDHFTLGWLMSRMHKHSFGLIMLLLAVVAIAPGVSIVAGLLLMIPAFQMILGQNMPVFPRRIAARPSLACASATSAADVPPHVVAVNENRHVGTPGEHCT
jgi:hypothetical protein